MGIKKRIIFLFAENAVICFVAKLNISIFAVNGEYTTRSP